MPDDPTRRYVVSPGQVRLGYALGGIGAVSVIVGILLLATARPSAAVAPVDTRQHDAALVRADAALSGFEVRADGSARLDIDHAMRLVAERGVDLPLTAGGAPAAVATPVPEAPPAADEAVIPQEGIDAEAEAVPATPAVDGGAVYAANCAACHQATGAGIPAAFPPLADHVGDLYAADRGYLIDVLLYGLQGPITVNGQTYNGLMPAWPQLSDAQIAAVLDHTMTAWGDAEDLAEPYVPYSAEEVAEARGRGLSAADVAAERAELDLP
jgi:mono/diheme cytochrome c family protein